MSICNVIRGVMEGKAFVSLITDVLEDADIATIKFLVKVSMISLKYCKIHKFSVTNLSIYSKLSKIRSWEIIL